MQHIWPCYNVNRSGIQDVGGGGGGGGGFASSSFLNHICLLKSEDHSRMRHLRTFGHNLATNDARIVVEGSLES